jgi:hypothetical protein
MGQRISIKVLDLLAAGCTIKQNVIHYAADEQYPEKNVHTLEVLFPEGDVVHFDFNFSADVLYAEANYSERGIPYYVPALLERLKIDHIVV